ncbi:TIGR03757 family integrating conjugative element protein [Jejubacter sp. L23]|uniref:TIGR03757 family integrating conjugative element protein n=1 Tax=Jejubacter sp. L23 TaxID=3092086 RepID=UPI003D765E3C
MKLRHFILMPTLLPATVLAGTVIYTDSRHLPENLPPDIPVVLLDGAERLLAEMFGQLSADPERAAAQASQIIASPQWQQRQQQQVTSYRQVVRAWELGIRKVPAVVFDDRDVVSEPACFTSQGDILRCGRCICVGNCLDASGGGCVKYGPDSGLRHFSGLHQLRSRLTARVIVTNGAKVIHIRRLKSDPGVNLLS